MNLTDIFETEGRQGLIKLAEKVGCNHKFLWQCASGRREPSPNMARRLVEADPRLTIEAIYSASKEAA